ncbi:MAG: secretin N-terminal domain-containing protein [Candidatus Ratteibacteria bacterium]
MIKKSWLFILLILIFTSFNLYTQENLRDLYNLGVSYYLKKDYPNAIATFSKLKAINPNYRKSDVDRYLKYSQARLGKSVTKEEFKIGEDLKGEIIVNREDEFEKLAFQAQQALLETSKYFNEVNEKYNISDIEKLEPTSTFTLAQKAYDNNMFTESIRLASKARRQMEEIVLRKIEEEKPKLGEIGNKKVTIELKDMNLKEALDELYQITGVSYILSPNVSGKVTLSFKDIPIRIVLDTICEQNGLKYIEENGIIKIMTKQEYQEKIKEIQKARRVFKLYYTDANTIVKALREVFKGISAFPEPTTNSIIVEAQSENMLRNIEGVISTLDTPVSQVLLECKIVEVATSEGNQFSIDWLISSRMIRAIDGTLTGPRFGDDFPPTYTPGLTQTLPAGNFSFGVTNRDFNALISALATRGKAKVIQAPKITCINGTTAYIAVTRNEPYLIAEAQTTIITTSTGAPTLTTASAVNLLEEIVGTEFEVTPIIQRNRTVMLNLNIYDSNLVERRKLETITAGQTYAVEVPILSERMTTQSVVLYDKETLVIGGMIRSREEAKESGIPFLRKIPILGYLFKKPTFDRSKNELLIFITPHIISSYQESVEVSKPDIKKSEEKIEGGLLEKF